MWLHEDETNGRGTCHKHAPRCISRRRPPYEVTGQALGRWPLTMKDNFCGDHPAHAAQAHAQFAFYLAELGKAAGKHP
jgi:hypothetical protein